MNLDSVATKSVEVGGTSKTWSLRRLLGFMGPGFLVSIAYIDPGNFDTDITAGSEYQYQLIWVLAIATIMGMFVQYLAAKLGIVVERDLAQQCRRSYEPRLNIVLWIMAEISVIASDVPEVVGTAFALNLLFGIPLLAGVIITALDTFLFLFMQYISIRLLEIFIGGLLMLISMCFVIEMFLTDLDPLQMALGFIPLWGFGDYELGGSTKTRKLERSVSGLKEAMIYNAIECAIALGVSFFINFSIVAVSASTFYYRDDIGLNNASAALEDLLRHPRVASIVFGIALLASGQSSTITGTYAGQFVMEGFLDFKIAMWKRNLITRSVAMVPSVMVVVMAGEEGSDALIVWSQVLLSIQLPFALIPLLQFTSHPNIMGRFLKNSRVEVIMGWSISLLVIVANMLLVVVTFRPWMDFSTLRGQVFTSIMVFFMILYFFTLFFISFVNVGRGQTPPDIVNDQPSNDTMFGEEMTEYSGGRISDEDGEDVTEGGSALDVMPSHEDTYALELENMYGYDDSNGSISMDVDMDEN